MTQLPAYLANRSTPKLADQTVAHLGVGSPPYISIMGNRFTLIDATGAEQPIDTLYLDCVIVDAGDHMSKIFYDKPFDPNAGQYEPPVCFSDNGVAPSRNASKPQARTCAECPNAVWGSKVSAVSGKCVKACSDFQKLAIMLPGDPVTFLLRVPPNSLAHLRGYLQKFVGQPVDVSDVVTRLSFEAGQIGLLQFNATGYITEDAYRQREALRAEKKTDALVGRLDQPRVDTLPPSAPAQQLPPPAQEQSVPFVPTAAPTAAPQTQSAPLAQSATRAAPTTEPAPRQRRRRTTAQAAPQHPASPPPTQAAPNNFGMAQPQAAPDEIDASLDSIFGSNN